MADKFSGGDCGEYEVRKASASTKIPTGADYLSFDYVSHAVSKNVSNYLTPDTKKTLDQLRQAFNKAPILKHFDPEQYIRVETEVSGYAIGGVLSQLINNPGQWHPLAYFLHKTIFANTQYKTHNVEF